MLQQCLHGEILYEGDVSGILDGDVRKLSDSRIEWFVRPERVMRSQSPGQRNAACGFRLQHEGIRATI